MGAWDFEAEEAWAAQSSGWDNPEPEPEPTLWDAFTGNAPDYWGDQWDAASSALTSAWEDTVVPAASNAWNAVANAWNHDVEPWLEDAGKVMSGNAQYTPEAYLGKPGWGEMPSDWSVDPSERFSPNLNYQRATSQATYGEDRSQWGPEEWNVYNGWTGNYSGITPEQEKFYAEWANVQHMKDLLKDGAKVFGEVPGNPWVSMPNATLGSWNWKGNDLRNTKSYLPKSGSSSGWGSGGGGGYGYYPRSGGGGGGGNPGYGSNVPQWYLSLMSWRV